MVQTYTQQAVQPVWFQEVRQVATGIVVADVQVGHVTIVAVHIVNTAVVVNTSV
jgi:hypothetical protein